MIEASTVGKTSLCGRAPEQDAIAAVVTDAATGRGGALVLLGDLGSGKTTMLRFAAAAADFTVVAISASEREAAVHYAVLHRLLAPLLGTPRDCRPGSAGLWVGCSSPADVWW